MMGGGDAASVAGRNGVGSEAIATVNGTPITEADLQAAQERLLQGQPLPPSLPPATQVSLKGASLVGAIQGANAVALAKEKGADTSDTAITKFVETELPKILKAQVMQAPGMKPNATDAEIDAFVKSQAGKTFSELVKEQVDTFKKNLTDPQKGPAFRAQVIPLLGIEATKAKIPLSNEDLRKSYDVYEIKRLVIPSFTQGGPDDEKAKAKADEALAAIRGGLSFDAALDKYSSSAGAPGQKPSAAPALPVPVSQVGENPQYKGLVGLKSGEVSGVERGPEGYVITKIVGQKSDMPKDFDARKDYYRDVALTQRAQKAFQDELKRFTESNPPKFSSDGYKVLYDYTKLMQPDGAADAMTPPPPPTEAQLRSIIDQAKRVNGTGEGTKLATLVRAQAFDRLYTQAKDKSALENERLETLTASVEAQDDFDTRMTLVDLFTAKGDVKGAAEQLEGAARANTDYTPAGQDRFGKIASKLLALKSKGNLPADLEQRVYKEQERWRKEKKASDEAQAQAAKQQAEDARKMMEAQKAAEEASKKAKANPKVKDVTPPAPKK